MGADDGWVEGGRANPLIDARMKARRRHSDFFYTLAATHPLRAGDELCLSRDIIIEDESATPGDACLLAGAVHALRFS